MLFLIKMLTQAEIIMRDCGENLLFNKMFKINDIDTIQTLCDNYNNDLFFKNINKNKLLLELGDYNNSNVIIECYELVIKFMIKNNIFIEKQTCCETLHNNYMIVDFNRFNIFIDYLDHCDEEIKMVFIDFNFRNTDNRKFQKYLLEKYGHILNIVYLTRHIEPNYVGFNCPIYGWVCDLDQYFNILRYINVAKMVIKHMIKKYKKNIIPDETYISTITYNYHDEDFNEIPYFLSLGYLLNEKDFECYSSSVYDFYKSQVGKIVI